MTDMERNLRYQLRKESDEMIFERMELSDTLKQRIRQQAAAEQPRRVFGLPRAWAAGLAALTAAIMIVAVSPVLLQPDTAVPGEQTADGTQSSDGAAGSELTQLITATLQSVEEAIAAFGPELLVPSYAPANYELSEITTAGMAGEPVRDVVLSYVAGEKTLTFTASRMAGAFPVELFAPQQVNGADGYVLEQAGFTELFWTVNGIHYGIAGPITAAEAMKMAESLA